MRFDPEMLALGRSEDVANQLKRQCLQPGSWAPSQARRRGVDLAPMTLAGVPAGTYGTQVHPHWFAHQRVFAFTLDSE